MAYMDVKPSGTATGAACSCCTGAIFRPATGTRPSQALTGAGYRVIVPDQVGFGKSSKPDLRPQLRHARRAHGQASRSSPDRAGRHRGAFDGRHARRAHSPAPTRRAWTESCSKRPIGLEDYRNFAPPVETARIMADEDRLTPEAYRAQLMTNYSLTLPPEAITPFIEARMRIKEQRGISALAAGLRQLLPDDLEPAGGLRDPARATAGPVHHGRQRPQCARPRVCSDGTARPHGRQRKARPRAREPHAQRQGRGLSTASATSSTWKRSSVSTPPCCRS